ncbi:multicopper oxidase domain-containing protein [Herbidospora cretacea]|uniref:multicopper oxidase domain-containing protein n=1 Tax=Herbidospora cretacea TaxID=28444 RepID=UPI0007735C74|nr:multicopper oxidase domain-containing protein [Herbidospora cretacea]
MGDSVKLTRRRFGQIALGTGVAVTGLHVLGPLGGATCSSRRSTSPSGPSGARSRASRPIRPAAKPVLERYLRGEVVAPEEQERGRLDTTVAQPGMVTRIVLRFDLPTGSALPATYIQHCHMLEHEDNEMMRPWQVVS